MKANCCRHEPSPILPMPSCATLNETLEARITDAVAQRMHAGRVAASESEDGSDRAADRRRSARLQQFADRDSRRVGCSDPTPGPNPARSGNHARSAVVRTGQQAARRAATLTTKLLAFSRQQILDPRSIDPNALVCGLADLLQRTLGETISLETVSGAGLWRAFADPAELENVLVNLAVNARDAMPDGGRLTIETSNALLDDEYVATIPEPVQAGRYVMVAVSDTGHGMDEPHSPEFSSPSSPRRKQAKARASVSARFMDSHARAAGTSGSTPSWATGLRSNSICRGRRAARPSKCRRRRRQALAGWHRGTRAGGRGSR